MSTNKKSVKRSLLVSVTALLISVAMLIGTTFAWFTDSVTSGVNKIVAGNLDVDLEMSTDGGTSWTSADGKTLDFVKAADAAENEKILWEPGCTYALPKLRVVNKGNLALKYTIAITGIKGDADLNKVITWTVDDRDTPLNELTGNVSAGKEGTPFTIMGHMQETAGNEYQNKTIDGISITVYATQYTEESDSFGKDYDKDAEFNKKSATIMDEQNGMTFTLESGKSYTVGEATVTVAENGDITYTNTDANSNGQTVTITTDGGTLTVNAPKDTVKHYGKADKVEITAVAGQSYHEFGKVDVLSIAKGRAVIENGDGVTVTQVTGTDAVIAVPENVVLETKLEKDGSITEVKLQVGNKETISVSAEGKTDSEVPAELEKVVDGKKTIGEAKDYTARVGTDMYETLQDAVNKADNNIVTLLKDTTENITISSGNVTLDLNGKTLTNASSHTITVNSGAELTINGNGTVDNVTHGKAAIVNYGKVTLNGGTYTRSLETGESGTSSGGNSYYTILNDKGATMVINDGASVINTGHFSSMIRNGGDEDATATSYLTINGGKFSGGINTVKNDELGNLVINNGTFTNTSQFVVMNWNVATIKGGSFTATSNACEVVFTAKYDATRAVGQLAIEGGNFVGSGAMICDRYDNDEDYKGTASVTGGTFSANPGFVADGYVANDNGNGTWTVAKSAE